MTSPSRIVARFRSSTLAMNAGWMLLGQGTNIVLQAAYFVLLARLLGPQEYGIFVGAFAFTMLLLPFSGLGSGVLFLRYVSSNHENFSAYWGNIVLAALLAGGSITVLLILVAPGLLNPASASIVLWLAIGNCICGQLITSISQVFQAYEKLHLTAVATTTTNLFRCVAVIVVFFSVRHATASLWAIVSLIASAAAMLVLVFFVCIRLGLPTFSFKLFRTRFWEGMGFSVAGSTQSVYNDLDKTMMSHYAFNIENGLYTTAYRVVDMACMPIVSLDSAALPRFFKLAPEGVEKVSRLSLRLAIRAALLGLLVSVVMFVGAPLIPHIIGSGFAGSVSALRWLCLLPVFRGLHQLLGSAVTATGFQRFRTTAQILAAAINFGLNLWLIPNFRWLGAAWASLATDGMLVVFNLSIFLVLFKRGRRVAA